MSNKSKKTARQPFTRITDQVRERIVAHIRKTGDSFAQTKEKYGVSAHTIAKICKEAGFKPAAKPAKADAGKKAVAAVKASAKRKPAKDDDVL